MMKTAGGSSEPTTSPASIADQNSSLVASNASLDSSVLAESESGTLHVRSGGTIYVGSAHWSAVLDSISELRDHFQGLDDKEPARTSPIDSTSEVSQGLYLLSGYQRPHSKEHLLSVMPERSVVDRLVFGYFNDLALGHCQFLPQPLPPNLFHPF